MHNKTLVITGCRGFIGMNFMNELIKPDRRDWFKQFDHLLLIDAGKLKGFDKHEWMFEQNYNIYKEYTDYAFNSMSLLIGDLSHDINTLTERDIRGITGDYTKFTVVNFASESHVDVSISKPFETYTNNVTMVPHLISVLGRDNIEEFWHIRTDEEYGHLESRSKHAFKVGNPLQPRNPYSASKASQTLFLESLKTTFDFPVKFFVLANQYGKYQHDSKMIPATIRRIFEGRNALVYGEGTQVREWTFVEDTVSIMLDTITSGEAEDVTHISNPKGLMSNNELVNHILRILAAEYGIVGDIEHIPDRIAHDFCYKLKSHHTQKLTTFHKGIHKTIDFYVNLYKSSL